ncbi:MAG: LysR family transcriptional regulator [Lachnospiraceae bacterium]|nr:LysR family transcriptional regulator [Lachnospiraceae bacterium]
MFSFIPYLKVIVESQNLSIAAEKLSITQPALSAALKKAEEQLQAPIFDRSQKPWVLTEVGNIYYQRGLQYLNDVEDLKQQLKDITNIQTGKLTIGGSNCFNTSYLPEAIATFSQQYPGIEIHLLDGTVPEMLDKTFRGEIDMFLSPGFPKHSNITYKKIFEEKILLCVPPEYVVNEQYKEWQITLDTILEGGITDDMAVRDAAFLKSFENYPFIMLQQSQQMGQMFRELVAEASVDSIRIMNANQMITSLSCTNAGLGISLISETAIRCGNFKKYPTFYLLNPDICSREMFVGYHADKYLSNASREFIKILENITKF